MAKIVAATNNKGGEGKTSVLLIVGVILAYVFKKRVLFIDGDQQVNLSNSLLGHAWDKEVGEKNASQLFRQDSQFSVNELGVPLRDNLVVIPGKRDDLFGLESILDRHMSQLESNTLQELSEVKEQITKNPSRAEEILSAIIQELSTAVEHNKTWPMTLKRRLDAVKDDYDYILIDLPPSISRIPICTWVAADFLLVPITSQYAVDGAGGLVRHVSKIMTEHNPNLKFIFFFNRIRLSSNQHKAGVIKYHRGVTKRFQEALMKNKSLQTVSILLNSMIRDSLDIPMANQDLTKILDKNSSVMANDFLSLVKEFIRVTQ